MQTHPDARRFRVTAPAMEPVVALEAALNMLQDAGIDEIERSVLTLSRRLAAGLDAAGYRRYGADAVESGIVTIEHPQAAEAHVRLRRRGIHASVRSHMLRLSPHGYNTGDEVDAVLAALADG